MGCVTAAGVGLSCFRESLLSGQGLVREIVGPRFDQLRIRHAAQIDKAQVDRLLSRKELSLTDPFSRYALIAAEEARQMADLEPRALSGPGTAVIIGTGIGGETTHDEGSYAVYGEKASRVDVLAIPKVMPSAAASHISMRYGTTGPSFAVSSACASASQAIGLGMMMLRHGIIQRAIVGGAEAMITFSGMRSWEALKVMSPSLCRPFSSGRNGMVLGEGAAVFVLETLEDAVQRNAPILACLAGYGTTSDGKDILRPDHDGCAAAIQMALDDAGLAPDAIDYINAHGTGTVANDVTEARAITAVFGERATTIPVSSTKPIHGHALGAAGAIELAATVIALKEQRLPANINWLGEDANCPLNIVKQTQVARVKAALSNSFAFGGVNAALVVKAYDVA